MNITVSKWGNSLGFRLPAVIVDAFGINAGDSLTYEVDGSKLIIQKEKSTRQLFENFYGKSMDQITMEDLGPANEIDWGEDVGGEIF